MSLSISNFLIQVLHSYMACLYGCGRECIELVKEVGDVTDIALTTHAYEHKLFVAPFARQFPGAKVCILAAIVNHSSMRLTGHFHAKTLSISSPSSTKSNQAEPIFHAVDGMCTCNNLSLSSTPLNQQQPTSKSTVCESVT